MKNRNVIYLIILFIILIFNRGWSSIAEIKKFEEIVKESNLIVDAVVKDIKYYFDHDIIGYAMITLSVKEVIKGECPDEILLRRWGVDKNNKFIETHLIREYSMDKRYILCLMKHPKGYYKVWGLIDGTFEVEKNGSIAEIGVSNDDFKQNIKNILSGNKDKFNIKSSISNKEASLRKENNNNMIASAGTHFDGKFKTYNTTWNTNYFPVKFYYNPISEPDSVRAIREQVFERINDAFTVWNNLSLMTLSFETISIGDTTDVYDPYAGYNIFRWFDLDYQYIMTETSCGYGIGNKYASLIRFNIDFVNNPYGGKSWNFDDTPIGRGYALDFTDALIHELGHTMELNDILEGEQVTYSTMKNPYEAKTVVVRQISDGDKAGVVHQQPVSSFSGTLPHSVFLSSGAVTNFSLTGNLTVPSGKTFELESGNTLNLGSYKIINNGTCNIYGTLNPYIGNENTKNYYSNINDAISEASSGNTIRMKSDLTLNSNLTINNQLTFILDGDLIVPSGKTLTLGAGVTLNMAANKELKIQSGGSLVATGTINNKITFNYQSGSGAWKGIKIESDNITMEYCRIYNTTDGIRVDGADDFTLKNSEINSSNNCGVYFMNECWGYLENNSIQYCSDAGVKASDAGASLKGNSILNCNMALKVTAVGSVNMPSAYGDEKGNNTLHNTDNYVFYFDGYSDGNWGILEEDGGDNSIYRYTPSIIDYIGYLNNADIDAEANWWGGLYPDANDFNVVSGNMNFDHWLSSNPNKVAVPIVSNEEDNAKKIFRDASKLADLKDYKGAWGKYKEVINSYPQSRYSRRSLVQMHHLKRKLPDEDFVSFLSKIIKENKNLELPARFCSINHLLKEGYVLDAIDNCEYFIKNCPSDFNSSYIIFMLYRINLEYLGNSVKAEEILSDLRKKDTGKDYISMADELMGDFKNGTLKRKLTDSEIANLVNSRIPKEVSDEKEVPSEFGISQNYPNPFNPVTTIKFAIPKSSNVKMVVYNMLGQEIETLLNSNLNAGYHEIKWDGSRCASGIYICRFEAGGYNKAIKLLLIK